MEEFLKYQGYIILDRNKVFQGAELDIVALEGDELVMVEVKTRSHSLESGLEAITPRKEQLLRRGVYQYIAQCEKEILYYRIDVAVVLVTVGGIEMEYFPAAIEIS